MRNTFVALTFILLSTINYACDCSVQTEMSLEYHRSALVIVGKVTKITKSADQRQFIVTIEVEKDFKGNTKGQKIIITTNSSGRACGYEFRVGQNYLIYANKDKRNVRNWTTSVCSRTCPLKAAKEDLSFITRETDTEFHPNWEGQFRDQ
ncbi:MAG: hypothetical protein ACI865_000038 [Flavobacteriaceae bacterium]|jgi:hypothetical protein